MRTKAQRRWLRKGVRHEMIPLRPQHGLERYSFIIDRREDWRSQRTFARDILKMPIRPICKQMIHNGGKP